MLHQCPCGGIVRFNGRFDGGQQAGALTCTVLAVRISKTIVRPTNESPTTVPANPSGQHPSNALPLSGGRPSAADHPLQRLVRRLSNQESEPRQIAIALRVFRAPWGDRPCNVPSCPQGYTKIRPPERVFAR